MRERGTMGQERSAGAEATKARGARGASHEEVARRAYELYMARGGQPGHAEDDWLQAERELRGGRPPKTAPMS